MSERQPYSRVYWSIQHDEKFDGIREDMRLIGSWITLLVIADQAWPAPAYFPPIVPKSAIRALCEAGLVDTLPGSRFRIRGLDSERDKRAEAGRVGGLASGRSRSVDQTSNDRSPTPGTETNLDETRRDENENETRLAETPRDAADIYWQLTGKFPAGRALDWIDNLASTYGHEATIRAIVKAQTADASVSNLLTRAQDILRSDARKLDLAERDAEKARLAEKRAQPRIEEPWRAEFREAVRRQYEGLGA